VDVSVPVADTVAVVVNELDCAMTVDNVADAVSMAEIKRGKEENIAGGQSKFTVQSPLLYRARKMTASRQASRWVLDGVDEGDVVVSDVDDAMRTAQVAVPTVGHGCRWQTSIKNHQL